MDEVKQVEFLLQFIRSASRVLSARMTMLLALLLTFVLFAWSMASGDYLHLVIAGIFGILVFIPTVWLDIDSRKDRAVTVAKE